MPFFGVPIRNGLPIGLGSVAGFGVQQFDPSQLFEGGTVAGAWYDPSDLSTMFDTSAGTTPVAMPGGGSAVVVGRMLDKSGNGNHAISFNNTTARPELRARVNLLTYSEEFDNGVWTKLGATAANTTATTDPLGGNTADVLTSTFATAAYVAQSITAATTTATFSCYIKAGTSSVFWLYYDNSTTNGAAFFGTDLTTQALAGVSQTPSNLIITDAGSGWFRISAQWSIVSGTRNFGVGISDAKGSFAVTIGRTGYIWGADLRPANIGANVPAYQRIADANTYDTNGFPLYLRFDGIDDSMYTPANLNLSGTDKVSVFAGVRKLSDAAAAVIAELSASFGLNSGTFLVMAADSAGANYYFGINGTGVGRYRPTTYTSPISNVLAASYDIGGAALADEIKPRINGVLNQSNPSGIAGTGNFGTYPLYIGSRGNSSLWLNGHLYSLVIAGSAVSAGNISATEQWVAGKTGIQI